MYELQRADDSVTIYETNDFSKLRDYLNSYANGLQWRKSWMERHGKSL